MDLQWYHWFVLILTAFLIPFIFYTRKFRNPYKLIMVFGKKGSGKSTLITKLCIQFLRKGRVVYSTVPVPGARLFDVRYIGHYNFPPESVVFIDEVGMIWDNREYKAFKPEVRDWFKLQRHNRVTVYLFSQTFDVDIKLRNLTDYMYLVQNHFGIISIAKKIKRGIVIVNPDGQSEARIADSLEFEPFFLSLFGLKSWICTYIPHWTKYFDSFALPDMAEVPYDACPDFLLQKCSRKLQLYFLRKKLQMWLYDRFIRHSRLATIRFFS